MPALAKRISSLQPSITLAITAKANQMKAQGIDVIGFGAGEPDFATPKNIRDAAITAIESGFTRYTPSAGIPELREAICRKLMRDQGLSYTPAQIVVATGGKHALYDIFQAIINPGDEVIIPAPYWVSYPEQVKLAGGVPVFVETSAEDGFELRPEELEKLLTPKTKAIVLNSPNNPTGAVYSEACLRKLADVLMDKDLYIISDEMYEKLIYGGEKHVSIASLSEKIMEKTILVSGVSKTYSMTGWRIGFTACHDQKLAKILTDLQSQSTSNADSIAQKASVAAYDGPQDEVEMMRVEFEKRRDYIVDRLNAIEGIDCKKPKGAFYVFPSISGLIGKTIDGKTITDSFSCAEILLEKAKIAVVPGSGFGAENFIRMSYAISMEAIKEGLDRLEQALKG